MFVTTNNCFAQPDCKLTDTICAEGYLLHSILVRSNQPDSITLINKFIFDNSIAYKELLDSLYGAYIKNKLYKKYRYMHIDNASLIKKFQVQSNDYFPVNRNVWQLEKFLDNDLLETFRHSEAYWNLPDSYISTFFGNHYISDSLNTGMYLKIEKVKMYGYVLMCNDYKLYRDKTMLEGETFNYYNVNVNQLALYGCEVNLYDHSESHSSTEKYTSPFKILFPVKIFNNAKQVRKKFKMTTNFECHPQP